MKKLIQFNIVSTIITVSCMLVLGQSGQPPKPKVAAKVAAVTATDFFGYAEKGKYVNAFFGFRLSASESYIFLGAEEAKIQSNAGIDMAKGENGAANKKFDEAAAKQATLFGWLESPMGTPGNAVIESVVLKQAKGVTANMALAASISLLTTNPNFKIDKALGKVTFGRRSFSGAIMAANFNGNKFSQEMYTIMLRGYSGHFALTYFNEEGRQKMLSVMRSIEFTK